MCFNQNFNDLNAPESGFNKTFTPSNTKNATSAPLAVERASHADVTGIFTNDNAPSAVSVHEGASDTILSANYEVEHGEYSNAKKKVRFHDTASSMPQFTNLQNNGPRRSPRLKKGTPTHQNDDLVHIMFTHQTIRL